jgi:hypothetical protein
MNKSNQPIVISKRKQLQYMLQYGQNPHNRPDFYIITLILLIIIIFLIYIECSPTLSAHSIVHQKITDDMLGLILDITTLSAIISVWLSGVARDWKNQLQKYLSVSFTYNDKTNIEQDYVLLINQSDIRQMAQSLGQAWNNGYRLPIQPSIQTMQKKIKQDKSGKINNGRPFTHFSVTIELEEDIVEPQRRHSQPKFKCLYNTTNAVSGNHQEKIPHD